MAITRTVYDTETLLGVMVDDDMMEPPSNYWLSLCFPQTVQFDDEFIDFQKMQGTRKIAPLVVPTVQGVPIYARAEASYRVKPAYIKPKDPVSATRVIKRAAGFGELHPQAQAMSPQARYDAIVADILSEHRRAIERRWEWMASEAIQNGTITLEDENYPRTVIDFERNASHTVTLAGGALWDASTATIMENVETWKKVMRRSKHGGPSNRLTVGTDVWDVMRKDPTIKEFLKTDYSPETRGNMGFNLGVLEGLDVEWVGRINGTTDVYVYSDYYENDAGTAVDFMNSKDVVMTGPNVQGIRAYASIQDKAAGWAPLPIFPKMWDAEDPSATFVMSQSAPLMVPINPNATFRARVLS